MGVFPGKCTPLVLGNSIDPEQTAPRIFRVKSIAAVVMTRGVAFFAARRYPIFHEL